MLGIAERKIVHELHNKRVCRNGFFLLFGKTDCVFRLMYNNKITESEV